MTASRLTYVTVDVFTHTKFAGNPLAIVEVPADAKLTQELKQIIAREFNYSETVFLHANATDQPNHTWKIDIFMTTHELPFAGHPTIGTACHVLSGLSKSDSASNGLIEGTFITKAGKIHLQYDVSKAVAKAEIPHNVHLHQQGLSQADLVKLQPALVLNEERLRRLPKSSAVFSIVKGMTFALIELENADDLRAVTTTQFPVNAQLDQDWDQSFVGSYFYVKLPASEDGVIGLQTRMIEMTLEDPATGSAASALASYLSMQDGGAGQTFRYAITQGVEMGRKSDIGVEVTLSKDSKVEKVVLSGGAVAVMEGTLAH